MTKEIARIAKLTKVGKDYIGTERQWEVATRLEFLQESAESLGTLK